MIRAQIIHNMSLITFTSHEKVIIRLEYYDIIKDNVSTFVLKSKFVFKTDEKTKSGENEKVV